MLRYAPMFKLRLISLLALLCLCGCHTPLQWDTFKLSDPGWTTWTGQAVWRPTRSMPELTGDLTVAVNTNGLGFVQFTKTIPFATARLDGRRWQIEFPAGDRLYSGRYPLPRHLGLLQLPALATGEPVGKRWTKKGDLNDWELRNDGTGETLHGYLNKP